MSAFKLAVIVSTLLIPGLLLGEDDGPWVLNLPGSPMYLDGQSQGAYTLKNISEKRVASFRLACIDIEKNEAVIVSKFPFQKFSIPPHGSFGEAIVDAPYTDVYAECVLKLKAKVALISVVFEDRTSWSFTKGGARGKSGATHPQP